MHIVLFLYSACLSMAKMGSGRQICVKYSLSWSSIFKLEKDM